MGQVLPLSGRWSGDGPVGAILLSQHKSWLHCKHETQSELDIAPTHLVCYWLYAEASKKLALTLEQYYKYANSEGNYYLLKVPSVNMYHSITETSHPLQAEEQEIGIDPLQSYVNKPDEAKNGKNYL
ncbi:Hypothetical predicted protein [Podarcis lilfordi]|uniref:Uncharacterized protein n=1 Tax=Podarcis lilfordi TaxID=74358 RepID=A0AA35L3F5_9SAUR|nr:Hypothetical predicted protein [Podarcis lilfordi]